MRCRVVGAFTLQRAASEGTPRTAPSGALLGLDAMQRPYRPDADAKPDPAVSWRTFRNPETDDGLDFRYWTGLDWGRLAQRSLSAVSETEARRVLEKT